MQLNQQHWFVGDFKRGHQMIECKPEVPEMKSVCFYRKIVSIPPKTADFKRRAKDNQQFCVTRSEDFGGKLTISG